MPNVTKIAICPYYIGESNSSITCEDTNHSFESIEARYEYMDQYCCTRNYIRCPHAQAMEEKYERIEAGADVERTETEARIRAMEREMRHKATLLGKAGKRIERQQKKIDDLRAVNKSFVNINQSLEKQNRRFYDRARAAEAQLERQSDEIYAEISRLISEYDKRLAYLLDRYEPNGLSEDTIQEWASGKVISIVDLHGGLGKDRVWKAVYEDGKTESNEEAGASKKNAN